jgi:hypothetical protein
MNGRQGFPCRAAIHSANMTVIELVGTEEHKENQHIDDAHLKRSLQSVLSHPGANRRQAKNDFAVEHVGE